MPERPIPSSRSTALSERLQQPAPLLLDGATGTELEALGVAAAPPLWSARALIDAPQQVEAVHRSYVEAGSEILTANTFRTQARALARAGLARRAAELTALAVALARSAACAAARERPVWVAGSMAPLEDCYRPDLVPDDAALAREHSEQARNLATAGADLLLLETFGSVREGLAALRAARETGLPVWLSWIARPDTCLGSGEPLEDALAAAEALTPDLVGVNCLPPRAVRAVLPLLARAGRPFFVYPNFGEPDPKNPRPIGPDALSPRAFAEEARAWVEAGARAVGGCCGTTPAHIRALADTRLGTPGRRDETRSSGARVE